MTRAKGFGDAAPNYVEKGWSPVPYEAGTKKVAITGATGNEGTVTPEKIERWRKTYADNGLGLRHDPGTMALDVDDYDDRGGAEQLAALKAAFGELPATFSSTARGDDSPSRQYFFKIPPGVRLKIKADAHIDIVQHHHRTSAVWPTINPKTGTRYQWYAPNGARMDGPPSVDDLPALPTLWVEKLRSDGVVSGAVSHDATVEEFRKRQRPGKPSKAARAASARIQGADTSHDDMYAAVGDLVRLGKSQAGILPLIDAARERYSSGWPARYAKAFDDALLDQIAKKGKPPVTLDGDAPATVTPRRVRRIDKATRRKMLAKAQRATRRWFGDKYDLDVQLIVWAAAAVEQLDGDPVWLLIVGGPGGAKTETGMPLQGAGARVVSSIASQGSLLSATSKGERTNDATGGLLREMGDRGLLFIKDFTSIMSQNSNTRAEVLAALREIYDGQWIRDVGTDGGRSLEWNGRLVVIGAVTTAWDAAHTVVATMGDRFALVRMDSSNGRLSAGRQALANVGSEAKMRRELAKATASILGTVDKKKQPSLKGRDVDAILAAAELVTRARTAVENDYAGNPLDAHAPEAATRFAKQVGQIMRGAIAIGVKRDKALSLAIRSARDSMPPLRLSVLEDVAANPGSLTSNVVKRLQKPRTTIDRTLQALHLLGLVVVDEETHVRNDTERVLWRYSLAPDFDLAALSTDPLDPFITTH